MIVWLKIVATLIIAFMGWGIVTPRLISMNSDFAVLMGVINGMVVVPAVITLLWRGFRK